MLKKTKGFTLIEMMVVIGILTIMAIIIIPNYRSYSRRNQLRESAQLVRSAIVEAQNDSLASKHPGTKYGAKYLTANSFGVYNTGTSAPLKSYTLPSFIQCVTPTWNISFTSYSTNAPFTTLISPCPTPSIQLKIVGSLDPLDSTTINVNCNSGQTNITNP